MISIAKKMKSIRLHIIGLVGTDSILDARVFSVMFAGCLREGRSWHPILWGLDWIC